MTVHADEYEGKETHPLLTGAQMYAPSVEISVGGPLESGNRSTERFSYTTLGHVLTASTSHCRDTCPSMPIAALFIIARNWKKPWCFINENEVH